MIPKSEHRFPSFARRSGLREGGRRKVGSDHAPEKITGMYQAIVFLPLLGCLIAGLFGRTIGARPSELVTTVFLFASMLLSWFAFYDVGFAQHDTRVPISLWI